MASANDGERQREQHEQEAGTPRSDEAAEAGHSGVRATVETVARVYFDFCKRAARTVNRFKSDD